MGNYTNNKYKLYLYLILICFTIMNCIAQEVVGNKSIMCFFNKINFDKHDYLDFDTLKYKNSFMLLPKGTNDKLIITLRNALLKEKKEFKKLTNEGYNIEKQLEVKSYVKSSFISIVQNIFYENSTLHNISFSTNCYNFLIHNDVVFEVLLKSDKALIDSINSVVKRTFDEDCMLNEELRQKYQIFFCNGKPYINNPFNSRVCNDSLYIPNIQSRIYFVKIKR